MMMWAHQLSYPLTSHHDKSVLPRGIADEGGNTAYPGIFAVEPKMVPRDFYFDMVLGCLTHPIYISSETESLTSILTTSRCTKCQLPSSMPIIKPELA